MAVPTVITDCSATAASNSPLGSDTIGTNLDNFLRINSALIRQVWDIATVYSATVGGTANAITLTPTMALTAYKTGQRIAFKATGNSSASVTLNVSAVGVKKVFSTDGATQLTSGDIVSGKYYTLIYDATLDTAAGGWMLDGSGNFLTSVLAAATYAPLASPVFTGAPSLPTGTIGVTQAITDSSTALATTAFAKTAPTIQKFLSGSGTYTTPSGCLFIKVRMVGGGGGSGGLTGAGGTGGTSTFGSWTTIGGAGGRENAVYTGGAGGAGGATGSGTLITRINGAAGGTGYATGAGGAGPVAGGVTIFGGAGMGAVTSGASSGQAGISNTGSGAAGSMQGTSTTGGGGAAEYVEFIVTSPAASYSYAVGAGGTAGTGATIGALGGSGVILVEEYYIG